MFRSCDIAIIGAGPAGVSAGIYALRAGVKVVIIDGGESALNKAKEIQNYYGVTAMSGKELVSAGHKQFKDLGGELINGQVLKIIKDYQTNLFTIKTEKEIYSAKAVVLCMGAPKRKTNKEFERFENVSYCAICDGFFYKNKTVAVLGDGDFAFSECEELEKIVKKIYLIAKNTSKNNKKSQNIEQINKEVKEFKGDVILNKIIFKDGSEIEIDGMFVAEGILSSFELTKQLGIIEKNNFILVDKNFMTNVAGAFSAGDMIGGLLQVSKAVSDGANAGLEAVRYIKMMEIEKLQNK